MSLFRSLILGHNTFNLFFFLALNCCDRDFRALIESGVGGGCAISIQRMIHLKLPGGWLASVTPRTWKQVQEDIALSWDLPCPPAREMKIGKQLVSASH